MTVSGTFVYENLIAGTQQPLVNASGPQTLISGQNIVRGTLLGAITKALGAITPGYANVGNGTIGGTPALGPNAKIGTYVLVVTDVTEAAVFSVTSPDGRAMAPARAGTPYIGDIDFTPVAGAVDWVAGDSFTIVVGAGSGKLTLATLAAVDGSQAPYAVAAEDMDATGGDSVIDVFVKGEFSQNGIVLEYGDHISDWQPACEAVGIYLRPTTSVGGV